MGTDRDWEHGGGFDVLEQLEVLHVVPRGMHQPLPGGCFHPSMRWHGRAEARV